VLLLYSDQNDEMVVMVEMDLLRTLNNLVEVEVDEEVVMDDLLL
jgi:hypothetical protein